MNRIIKTSILHERPNSTIIKVRKKDTKERLIMKQLKKKYYSWMEIISLREINCLRRIIHPSIIKLKEVIKDGDKVNLVFEEMDTNLQEFLDNFEEQGNKVPENMIKIIIYQIASGLVKLHAENFVHRDIKLDNILVTGITAKLSDFSNGRNVNSKEPLTDYVSSRWYRAPEILIKCGYTTECDLYSLGCVMAELYHGKPLFPGNSEIDQLYLMNKVFFSVLIQKVFWDKDDVQLARFCQICKFKCFRVARE